MTYKERLERPTQAPEKDKMALIRPATWVSVPYSQLTVVSREIKPVEVINLKRFILMCVCPCVCVCMCCECAMHVLCIVYFCALCM